jgi:serine/threonine protein kinase
MNNNLSKTNYLNLKSGDEYKKYNIEKRLNIALEGEVYLALDSTLNQRVIIKFIPIATEDAIQELLAMYSAWEKIDKKYTARWLDFGVVYARDIQADIVESYQDLKVNQICYQVLEYIEGVSIEKFLEQGIPTTEKALEIGSKIIQAVSAIHTAQWTHRDIKPANIILDADNSVRIMVFGLSQRINEPAGVQWISLGYTPPEVCKDEPAPWSYAGDVYSTASVILALLLGEKALVEPNFNEQKNAANLKELVGNEIADLLLQDIDPNPKNRHESVVTMLQEWNSLIVRRKENPNLIDYKKILQKIDALAKEKDDDLDYSNAEAYRNKANLLRNWLMGGAKGDYPVDLSEFGVDVIFSSKPEKETLAKKAEEKKSTAKPETASAEEEGIVSFSPEERALQEQLKEIREYLNTGRLREAVALASIVESRATSDAKITASELLEEARQKRETAIEFSLKKADSVFKTRDKEQARQYYEFVLVLDPDNERAKSAMRQIESDASSGKLAMQKLRELRSGLQDIKNIKRLGAAVYEAEALYSEGELTEELSDLLEKAREKYYQIRTAQGEETRIMRFGDLSARKEARDKIAFRLAQGERFIFDSITNEEKLIFDLLREADKLLEKQSKDTMQHEVDPDAQYEKSVLRQSDGGSTNGMPPDGGNSFNKFEQQKSNFKISIAYPRLLSKRFESSFLLHIYFPEKRSHVTKNIRAEFQEQKTNEPPQFQETSEYILSSSVKLQQKIKIKLFSPAFDFPESVTKLIDNPINKIIFLGMPKDNCVPGFHKVLISILDANTDQEFESFAISVRVVDFAFDHISRPMLSRVSAVVLGIGSFVMFILTSLEQIDKTVGLTSGTAAGVFALGIYAGFYNLYQRVRLNTP